MAPAWRAPARPAPPLRARRGEAASGSGAGIASGSSAADGAAGDRATVSAARHETAARRFPMPIPVRYFRWVTRRARRFRRGLRRCSAALVRQCGHAVFRNRLGSPRPARADSRVGGRCGASGRVGSARKPDFPPKVSMRAGIGAIVMLSDGSSVLTENVEADDAANEFSQPFVPVRCVMRVVTPDRSAPSRLSRR